MYPTGFPQASTPFYISPYWPSLLELPKQTHPTGVPHVQATQSQHDVIVATNCMQCLKEQRQTKVEEMSTIDNCDRICAEKNVQSSELKFGIQRILAGKTDEKQGTTKESESPNVIKPTPYIRSSAACCTPTCCVLYTGPLAFPTSSPHMRPPFGSSNISSNSDFSIHDSTNQQKRKRSWSRAVFSNLQRKGLEKRFEIQKYVTKPDRRQLAAMLGLTDAQVKVWFQNRRMKWRHSKESEKLYESKQTTEKEREEGVKKSHRTKFVGLTDNQVG